MPRTDVLPVIPLPVGTVGEMLLLIGEKTSLYSVRTGA